MKIKIKVTKDILRRSMLCGVKDQNPHIGSSCAIALAVRDIFPKAHVGYCSMRPLGVDNVNHIIYIDAHSTRFISKFDSLLDTPGKRLDLPEHEFEVELPDDLVELINIDDIHKSPTLEVVAV